MKIIIFIAVVLLSTGCYGLRSKQMMEDPYLSQEVRLERKEYSLYEIVSVLETNYRMDVCVCTNMNQGEIGQYKINILDYLEKQNHSGETVKLFRVLDAIKSIGEQEKYLRIYWSQQYKRRLEIKFWEWVDPE